MAALNAERLRPMTRAMRQQPIFTLVLAVAAMVFAVVGPGNPQAGSGSSAGAEVAGAAYRLQAADATRAGARHLDASARADGFRFRAQTEPAQRDAFLAAVGRARPEARELIALVDGVTGVRLEATDGGAVGVTVSAGTRYDVAVDMGAAAEAHGTRGIDRVVLHELGHVIDAALLTDRAAAPLDAAIPAPAACEAVCASPAERFAETFAKWATGDAGADLGVGYDVALPAPSLDAWGRQLLLAVAPAPDAVTPPEAPTPAV